MNQVMVKKLSNLLTSNGNSSRQSQHFAACPRASKTLRKTSNFCMEAKQTGTHDQAAKRRTLSRQKKTLIYDIKYQILLVFSFCFTYFFSSCCFSLSEEPVQVLQFRADSADINQQTHRGVYIGHLQIDRGATHIEAAKAITLGDAKNQLTKAIIKGDTQAQAHYWSTAEANKEPFHAYADTIIYHPQQHLIELKGNARVLQGKNSFSAPIIIYDIQQQHVITKQQGRERTLIIIHSEPSSSRVNPDSNLTVFGVNP